MGLYDDLICEYPLPDGFKGNDFQTKDLECIMLKYRITADGILERELENLHPVPNEERGPGGFPFFRREHLGWEDTGFHGVLNFYTLERIDDVRIWHEYNAKFTDGKLMEITKVERS